MSLLCREIDPSQIDSRVEIDTVTVSDEKVTVISDEETLSKVDRVIAILPTSERITKLLVLCLYKQSIKMEMSYQASLCRLDTTIKITTKAATSSSSNSSTSSSEGSSSSTVQKQKSNSSKQ